MIGDFGRCGDRVLFRRPEDLGDPFPDELFDLEVLLPRLLFMCCTDFLEELMRSESLYEYSLYSSLYSLSYWLDVSSFS